MKPDPLRSRLRSGDPAAAAPELEARALARLRRRVAELEAPSPARPLVAVLLPAAAVVIAVLALSLHWLDARSVADPAAFAPARDESSLPGDSGTQADDGTRQLQFETPGGTRVVWLLDPDFVL